MPTVNDPNGTPQTVNSEGRAFVHAVTSHEAHHSNHDDGQAYSCSFPCTDTGDVNMCIGYLKNDSDIDLIITEIMIVTGVADTTISFRFGETGTPANTTAVTPVNRNAGSGNLADVTAYVSDGAAAALGLTGGSTVFSYTVLAAGQSQHVEIISGFIIPKNKILTIFCDKDSEGADVRVGLGINFHSIEA